MDNKEIFYEVLRDRAKDDPQFFLEALKIKTGTGPKDFRDIIAAHQQQAFNDLVPAIKHLRDGTEPAYKRFWIERTKKASKDTDIAALLIWLIAFATRPVQAQVGAADREQAAILRKRMEDFYYYNPWLHGLLKISNYNVQGTNGLAHLEIVPADVGGSHGETPDILVCNELSHVTKWEFIENLMDNVDGVPNSIAILATNAGFKGSQVWKLRESVIKNDRWKKHIYKKPAPWHDRNNLEDAETRNSPSRHRRLWFGQWASGKGDAIDDMLIDRFLSKHQGPIIKPESDNVYVAGLDLGIKHDHSGVVVLGINVQQRKIRLATFKGFTPHNGEVDLTEVMNTVKHLHDVFHLRWVGYDPWQAKLMAQMLTKKRVPMQEVSFSSTKNLEMMANNLLDVLKNDILEGYDEDDRLLTDLGKLNILEKRYGLRLDSVSDSTGHADVATALVIALLRAVPMLGGVMFSSDDSLDWNDDRPLQEAELNALPDEFKELMDMDF